jgi:hypothetical protein
MRLPLSRADVSARFFFLGVTRERNIEAKAPASADIPVGAQPQSRADHYDGARIRFSGSAGAGMYSQECMPCRGSARGAYATYCI